MPALKRYLPYLLLWILASPILALVALRRGFRAARFFGTASRTHTVCECGEEVALVGLWRCSCGFTYRGHLLRVCPICFSLPAMVRCYECGLTTKLPDPR